MTAGSAHGVGGTAPLVAAIRAALASGRARCLAASDVSKPIRIRVTVDAQGRIVRVELVAGDRTAESCLRTALAGLSSATTAQEAEAKPDRNRRDHAARTLNCRLLRLTARARRAHRFNGRFLAMTRADDVPPNASLDHRFNPGDKLAGRYRIVNLIGEGAIGEVYEAFDEALAEPLALKTLRAQVASQAVTVERFRREIQLARKVTHRNVCRTYDLGRHEMPDGNVVTFLTMELLRGTSLDRYMRDRGRLTTDEALPFVLQMTAGLEAAHTAGVIHRDFKPGNLVLVPEAGAGPDDPQRLVISDFGLARRHGLGEETITSTGESLGTPLYMAPEQVHSGVEPITPATDLYALGIVMYELVTDEMPFKGNSTTVMALKRLKERPVSPREVLPDLDPRWEAVIMTLLERAPAKRYQTAAEVEAALTGAAPIDPADDAPTGRFGGFFSRKRKP